MMNLRARKLVLSRLLLPRWRSSQRKRARSLRPAHSGASARRQPQASRPATSGHGGRHAPWGGSRASRPTQRDLWICLGEGSESLCQRLHLLVQDVEGGTCFARLELFADASQRTEAGIHGELCLVGDHLACLAAILTAFAVAEDYPTDAHVGEHLARDLTRPSTRLLVPHVLCCN